MNEVDYELETEEMELDLDWISDFEKDNKIYDKFSLKNSIKINLNMIYLDKEQNIKSLIKTTMNLQNSNLIKKEELLYQITNNKKNHKLTSILIYNMDITDIKDIGDINENKYLKTLSVINDIELLPTMNCFEDLNSLYFIYTEKEEVKKCQTKKIHYTPAPKNPRFTKHNRKELKKTD